MGEIFLHIRQHRVELCIMVEMEGRNSPIRMFVYFVSGKSQYLIDVFEMVGVASEREIGEGNQ